MSDAALSVYCKSPLTHRLILPISDSCSCTSFDFANQQELDDADSFTSSSDESDSDDEFGEDGEQLHSFLIAGPNHSHSDVDETLLSDRVDYAKVFPDDNREASFPRTPSQHDLSIASAADHGVGAGTSEAETPSRREKKRPSFKKFMRDQSADSAEEFIRQGSNMSSLLVGSETKKRSKKHSAVIGRVAKTVKASTVITGKHVIKHSKNLGKGTVKGTVSAGRAAGRAIPVSSVAYMKQPRRHEPGKSFALLSQEEAGFAFHLQRCVIIRRWEGAPQTI